MRPGRESNPRMRVLQTLVLDHFTTWSGVCILPRGGHMLHSDTMKKIGVILISLVSITALIGAGLFLIGNFKPKDAGIRIDTTPVSNVYIDGVFVGKSPYTTTFPAKTVSLRLIPDSSNQNLFPFETNVKLEPGIETVVERTFGITEDESSGYIISFEKIGGKDASLTAISRPDSAQVITDGVSRGFTPYKALAITPAMHEISINSPGYKEKTVMVKTQVGYRLTFYAKLAKGEDTPADQSQTEASKKTYVEIVSTPTGFLRVRSKPGKGGEEIAEVKPGETYLFISEDAETGWFEIQYQEPKIGLPSGIVGWVSGEYAKKVELPKDSTSSAETN